MSTALTSASHLKPEIRLAQAISHFDAELSSEQKATIRQYRLQIQDAPPDTRDVMRLTAEIDQRSAKNVRGGRCFGPRMTNFLHAVQQFAAIGDVMVGGSQNLIACGVWSLVRLSLLVSRSFLALLPAMVADCFTVGRKLLLLPRKAIKSSHECWPVSSSISRSCVTISSFEAITNIFVRVLYRSSWTLSYDV